MDLASHLRAARSIWIWGAVLGGIVGRFGLAAETDRVRIVATPEQGVVPDAEIDSDGTLHVAFFIGGDVHYAYSSDRGQTFSSPLQINQEPGFAQGATFRGPDLAVGREGRVHLIWYNAAYQQRRPSQEWGVMYSRVDRGRMVVDISSNLNHRPSDNFSIAARRDAGDVAVVWMAGKMFVQHSADDGSHFSDATELSADPCECCGSRAIYTDPGVLAILYRVKTGDQRNTHLTWLTSANASWQDQRISQTGWPIDVCPMTGSFLQPYRSGYVAAWETNGRIYFVRAAQVSPAAPPETAVAPGHFPVILRADDGLLLVAWKQGTHLAWQLADEKLGMVGLPQFVDTHSAHRPAGAVTRDGQFLLFP